MKTYKFVVLTNPAEGREDEYNDWYQNTHLPDLIAIPGVVSAQRFKMSSVQRAKTPPRFKYMAIYEIETDDLQAVTDELGRRSGTPAMVLSDAMDKDRMSTIFEVFGDKVE